MDKKLKRQITEYKKLKDLDNILESRWLTMFLHLAAYKKENGHSNVPAKYPKFKSLGYWVRRQRLTYNNGNLDFQREKLLNLVGFQFRLLSANDWNKMYRRLKQYKKRNGHTNISETYDDKQLFHWLTYQRKLYWKGKLANKKLVLLYDIGVDMENKTKNRWEEKYEKLKLFKEKHGHLYVCRSFTDDIQLINFVKVLRRSKDSLSAERIKLVDNLGFSWIPGKKVSKLLNKQRGNKIWEEHFLKLVEFKKKFGHFDIPKNNKEFLVLRKWVSNQRYKYDNLPKERKKLLDSIGFEKQ